MRTTLFFTMLLTVAILFHGSCSIFHSAVPSIPGPGGINPTRSIRPYTTFELDQIRQQAKR